MVSLAEGSGARGAFHAREPELRKPTGTRLGGGIEAAFRIREETTMHDLVAGRKPLVWPLPPLPLQPDPKAEADASSDSA